MNTSGKAAAVGLALFFAAAMGWWLSSEFGRKTMDGLPSTPNTALGLAENELWLSELDASLRVVSETLATTGNLTGAISMLEVLEARIARSDVQGKMAGLRRALAADREKLLAMRAADLIGVASALDELAAQVDRLPLISHSPSPASRPLKPDSAMSGPSASGSLTEQIMQGIRSRLSEVVRIRRIEHPDALFLSPEQGALIAERLRLRLISARVALMSRQDVLLARDLSEAEKILNQAFDANDAAVVAAKTSLKAIAQSSARMVRPRLEQSLLAMETLRAQSSYVQPSKGEAR